LQELDDDLEWKVLYVGKAADSTSDLVLDEILVGPVPVGVNKFVLQADAPDPKQLEELLGVTVVLVTCSYREREFVRVGYYVNNEYTGYNPEEGPPPNPLDITLVTRQILADKPRVTKFPIPWGDENEKSAADNSAVTTTKGMSPDDIMGAGEKEGEPEPEPEPMEDEEEEEEEEDEPEGDEAEEEDLVANE
jgi:histone chaperone ASF1